MLQAGIKFIAKAEKWVAEFDVFSIIGFMTCLVLLFNSHGKFFALLSIGALATLVFAPSLRRSPVFWIVMVLIWIPRLVIDWRDNEDHVFFGIYWCMAIGLALMGKDAEIAIRFNARWLIGLSFLIATIWKVISPQYYEGELFHYKLLQDSRFRMMVTTKVAGLDASDDQANAKAIIDLRNGSTTDGIAQLTYPKPVSYIAFFMTYWTILIEGSLGILFLLRSTRILSMIRNSLLMIFAITTYAVVPVLGFGILFMTMGIANCEPHEKRTKFCYLATSALILVLFASRIAIIQNFA